MLLKTLLLLAAVAAPALAYEPVDCKRNDTQNLKKAKHITVAITDENNFCTMLTGYGVKDVASHEGCAEVYCHGEVVDDGHPMPEGYILSSHFEQTDHYVQITGCMNSAVWGQHPKDDGGQMDSHGWPFHCKNYKKFVSLLEPSTNTYCVRCCDKDDNSDCDTSHSTGGCSRVVPGKYEMKDGSPCMTPHEIQAQALKREAREARDERDERDDRDARAARHARGTRGTRDAREVRDARDTRDTQETEDTLNTQDTLDTQDTQGAQGKQNMRDTQDTQELQDMQDSQGMRKKSKKIKKHQRMRNDYMN
ncbi:hypothetical protein BGZ68_000422 [Mortierella alpina]|nr:hypothetical protein BGZ68_000422 [Mortierella alpina]